MTMSEQLLRFLPVATIWVAMLFVPAIAEAHVGHVFGHSRNVEHRAVHTTSIHTVAVHTIAVNAAPVDEAIPKAQPTTAAGQVQSGELFFAKSKNLLTIAADPHGCVNGCCGDGMICCGAAFTAGSPDLTPVMRSVRDRPVSLLRARGIEPDTLRKPPRNFVQAAIALI